MAARFPHGFVRCNRRRSERVLTNILEKMAVSKRLGLGISDEPSHRGICLLHWRLIKYGRPGKPMKEEEVKTWDDCETRLEKAERDEEIESYEGIESFTPSELISDDDEGEEEKARVYDYLVSQKPYPRLSLISRRTSYRDSQKWRHADRKKVKARDREQQQDSDEDDNVRDFHTGSHLITLRSQFPLSDHSFIPVIDSP
ncbi:hypothetical protein COOONC_22566 [Cooperia oncophora]